MLTDLKRATRALLRSPAYTLAAVATFAIGIGANATVFGVVNAVLLRAYPFRTPERLVALYETSPRGKNERMPLSPANFRDWRDGARSFDGLSAIARSEFTLRTDDDPERLAGARVSGDFLQTLGVTLAAGRGFRAEEDAPGAAPVAVISHALWQRRFGGDRSVVGRTVDINARPTTIVGVLPADFRFPPAGKADMLMPLAFDEAQWAPRGAHGLAAIGRLKPGVTREAGEADLARIAARIAKEDPDEQDGWSARAVPLHEALVGDARPALLVLLGAVGAVLLIGCANVANLTLARVAARQRATAVRAAMGAARTELVRHHLAESVMVGLLGGAAGLMLASLAARALPSMVPTQIPRIADTTVDWRVALFTFGVSLAASVIAGLVPAWQGSRADLNEVLRDGNKGSTMGAARARSRDLLFVSEVALSLLLLAGAGLAIKSLVKLLGVQPGFASDRVVVARVSLPRARYADSLAQARFWEQSLDRVRALRGVRSAGTVSILPLSGGMSYGAYTIEGRPPVTLQTAPLAINYTVSESYFDAMAIPLRRGRAFTTGDRLNAPLVAVVSEALVKQQFAHEDPLGKKVFPYGPDGPGFAIVGVVGDVKHLSLADDIKPALYLSSRQAPDARGWLVVRATGSTDAIANALRAEVRAVDPTLALADIQAMDAVVSDSVARQRFLAQLLGGFAVSALVLALVGIYGVVANTVSQRSAEFGIRSALGATSTNVLADVLGASLVRTGIGLAIGLAAALAAGRTLATQLYDVKATDPVVLAGIAALLVAVALVASWLPARRATKVSPMTILRGE